MDSKVITIGGEKYSLITDYKDITPYRQSLNRLTQKTYGFNFEAWYQQGYWTDQYKPYSLLHKEEIVANVSANPINFLIDGRIHPTLQIGTVMTEEAYRHKGLSRMLIQTILEEYENRCEMFYLYANDTVLDFYPKFGFTKADEYLHSKMINEQGKKLTLRKVNMEEEKDQEMVNRLVRNSIPVSAYSMIGNPSLKMFYLSSFLAGNIYYIKELDLAAVVSYEEDRLYVTDIFCEHEFDLDLVIETLSDKPQNKVSLGFTPYETGAYSTETLTEEGTTFFIKGKNLLKEGRFPSLSHA